MKPTYQFYTDGTAKGAITVPVHVLLDHVKRSRGMKTDWLSGLGEPTRRSAHEEICKKFRDKWLRTLEAEAARVLAEGEKTDMVHDYLKRSRGRKADEAVGHYIRPKTVTADATHWAPSPPKMATIITNMLIGSILASMVIAICS